MLNIKQIQYFAACAKTGSFSQAAELLFTTQSNVSKVIRSMEDDMRTQLFVRHAKGIELTLEGERAYIHVQRILENIDELRNRVVQFETDYEEATLSDFLEDTALVSETDKLSDDDNMVRLMTIHGSKGLEFPYVFLCGMEDRIFPSSMALNSDDEDALEEERRLCYVVITRAMKRLYLSCARTRMMHGSRNWNDISRFVK